MTSFSPSLSQLSCPLFKDTLPGKKGPLLSLPVSLDAYAKEVWLLSASLPTQTSMGRGDASVLSKEIK